MPLSISSWPPGLQQIGLDPDPPGTGQTATVNRLGQTAPIASTNITNATAVGQYQINGTLECTATGTGSVTVTIVATDDVGSRIITAGTLVMATLNRVFLAVTPYLASGNITWSSTDSGTGTYAVRMRCYYLG
jgi:hypothetical protein